MTPNTARSHKVFPEPMTTYRDDDFSNLNDQEELFRNIDQ